MRTIIDNDSHSCKFLSVFDMEEYRKNKRIFFE